MQNNGRHLTLSNLDWINYLYSSPNVIDASGLFIDREVRDTTEFIVIHHAGVEGKYTAIDIDKFHRKKRKWKSIAYTFFITDTGETFRLHGINSKTAGEYGYNNKTLSICLQGNFNQKELTSIQAIPLIKLVARLKVVFPYAKVIGHRHLEDLTPCPGKNINVAVIDSLASRYHIFN